MGSGLRSFYSELRRRKVMQTMAWYAGIAAVTIGVVSDGLVNIGLPEWLAATIIWICIAGFPVTFLASWFLKVGKEDALPETPARQADLEAGRPSTRAIHSGPHRPTIPRVGIHIQTLGGIRIFRDGEEITNLPRSPVRCALLAYIAVEKNPPKEKALGLLWPEKDPELARKSLNQTLTELRKDLGDDWVDSKGQFLVLREDVSTDLGPFQKAIRESDWEQAVAYYEGRFLDGFYLPGSYDFEEWQERISGSVALSERKANTRLIEARHRVGDLQGALALAKGWADRAPLDDGAQNWFIRLLAETGQRKGALRQADAFLAKLEREEEEPLPETLQLIDEIKKGVVGGGGKVDLGTPEAAREATPPAQISEAAERRSGSLEAFLRIARYRYVQLIVAGVVVFGIWGIWRLSLPELAPEKIVVFPIVERGSTASEGPDQAFLVLRALSGLSDLKPIDAWQSLSGERRRNPWTMGGGEARRIARRLGSARYIVGYVGGSDGETFVSLELHETAADSLIVQATGRSSVDDPFRATSQSIISILPHLPGTHEPSDLTRLTQFQPLAVTLWLDGEKKYRRLHFADAKASYLAALEADSTLAWAALKGALAANWEHESSNQAEDLVLLALSREELLSEKERYFAEGLLAHFRGQAEEATSHYYRAMRTDRDWAEIHAALGETFFHLLPRETNLTDAAEDAFREALAVDPDFRPAMLHLSEILMARGDLQGADTLIEKIRATDTFPDGPEGADSLLARLSTADLEGSYSLRLMIMRKCLLDSLPEFQLAAFVSANPPGALAEARRLAAGGAQLGCGERIYRAVSNRTKGEQTPGERWANVLGLSGILVASGRTLEARDLLREALADEVYGAQLLQVIGATQYRDFEEDAQEVAGMVRRSLGPDFDGAYPIQAHLLGQWYAERGDSAAVANLLHQARSRVSDGASADDVTHLAALEGQLKILQGDTAAAVRIWSDLAPDLPRMRLASATLLALGLERLHLAEINQRQGNFLEAIRIANLFDHTEPAVFLFFLPRSLVVRYHAAEALGLRRQATGYRHRLELLNQVQLLDESVPDTQK